MKSIELNVQSRTEFGKKFAKRFRREGLVPCNVYGGADNLNFLVSEKELSKIIYTPDSFIINFNLDGKIEAVVMREVQFHPVTDKILHADFYRVIEGKPVTIDIPVRIVGVSEGVKQGGKLMVSKRKLRVSGDVNNLPDVLDVDITNVPLGGSVFVRDLSYENLTMITPDVTAVCAVKMTRAARGAAAAAAAAANK